MTIDLSTSAMLVTLAISQWTARKHDKSVTKDVDDRNSAHGAGRYNKLLINKENLEGISKTADAARAYHYATTLPWMDNGARILPAELFMAYTDKMRDFKVEFENAVMRFARDYDVMILDARSRLGALYCATDYPPIDEISNRFGIDVTILPIPSAKDFRVHLNKGYVDDIRKDITRQLEDRQRAAVDDCWSRVRDAVVRIRDRCANESGRIHDTLMTSAEALADLLPALNLTKDPKLDEAAKELRALLVSPDRLREDKALRVQTSSSASAILTKWGLKE